MIVTITTEKFNGKCGVGFYDDIRFGSKREEMMRFEKNAVIL